MQTSHMLHNCHSSKQQREKRPPVGRVRFEVLAVPAVRHAGRQRQVGHLRSVRVGTAGGGRVGKGYEPAKG